MKQLGIYIWGEIVQTLGIRSGKQKKRRKGKAECDIIMYTYTYI